jgi:hypothetical protein
MPNVINLVVVSKRDDNNANNKSNTVIDVGLVHAAKDGYKQAGGGAAREGGTDESLGADAANVSN